MADVNLDIYKPNPNNQAMTPLQIMQLVGAANQNKLFNQTFDARQNIGEAYKRNVDQSGKIDNRGLLRDIAGTGGFLAGEGVGTANANATAQFNLDTNKLQFAQKTIGALAADPNVKKTDVARAVSILAQAGVGHDVTSGILDAAYGSKDSKELRKALAAQGIMSLGTEALTPEPGSPDEEGRIPAITRGQGILGRVDALPAEKSGVGMIVTNPPGFEKAAGDSAGVMGSARARATNFAADIYPMTAALKSLEKLGTTGTGPGTEELNTMKSFIQSNLSWMRGADKIIGDPGKIQDFDTARKHLTTIAGVRSAGFGHGTDQALATALTASPNTHISNLAAVDLTKVTIALRRMDQAQTLEADAKNISPGKYSNWAARWATNVDPRAFMVDLMTPEQLQNLNKTLKNPAERTKFNNSVKMAIEQGIITRPGGAHAPGE